MSIITVNGRNFKPFLSAKEISTAIQRIAADISRDYEGKRPLFIGILNGSFMFAADLFKEINIEAEINFIKLASYKGTRSTGNVITSIGLDENLNGRHVIILEDIVDTGKTLTEFLPQLQVQQPASLRIAALLHKPEALKFPLKVDYLGFSIPNKFVLGYGLDFDGLGRNIREIYQLAEE
jgi:hypoxanthine phosphoribosyltransferase